MVKIVWISRAIQDLNEISEYIAKDSSKYADLIADKIFDKTQILKEFPEVRSNYPAINSSDLSQILIQTSTPKESQKNFCLSFGIGCLNHGKSGEIEQLNLHKKGLIQGLFPKNLK